MLRLRSCTGQQPGTTMSAGRQAGRCHPRSASATQWRRVLARDTETTDTTRRRTGSTRLGNRGTPGIRQATRHTFRRSTAQAHR